MAAKLAKMASIVGAPADADDATIRRALLVKMDGLAGDSLADAKFDHAGQAEALEAMARMYEDASLTEEGSDEPPHATLRKMAARFRRMAQGGESGKGGEDKAEAKAQAMARELGTKLGVKLADGLTAAQMFAAIGAVTVSPNEIGAIVDRSVKAALERSEGERRAQEFSAKAAALVDAAIRGGYPEAKRADAIKLASSPEGFATFEAAVARFVSAGAPAGVNPVLFSQMTHAGAPYGSAASARGTTAGRDVKIVKNELATFVEVGGEFSRMAIEMADSADPAVRRKLDVRLGEHERNHPFERLLMANRVLREERPDLWEAAESPSIALGMAGL